jgi:hypothetical protein
MHYTLTCTVLFMLLIHYYTVCWGPVNVAVLLPVAFSMFLMSCVKNKYFLKEWTVFQDSTNRKISNSKQWTIFAIFYLIIINHFYSTLDPKCIHELSKERKGLNWNDVFKIVTNVHLKRENQTLLVWITRHLYIFIHNFQSHDFHSSKLFFLFRVKFTFCLV